MILSYHWQILEDIATQQPQLLQMVKIPQASDQQLFPSNQSPSVSMVPLSLKSPIFGILFCFYIEEPKVSQPQIELHPEISLQEEVVQIKVRKESRSKNYIYQEIQIDNCEIYDSLLILMVKVKYHMPRQTSKVDSIDKLIQLAGNKNFNLISSKTYTTLKKEIIIDSPVTTEFKYEKDSYIWIKISRPEDSTDEVHIKGVEILNWLSNGDESVKREWIVNQVKESFRLKPKQSYALLFEVSSNVQGVEMPYAIEYRLWNGQGYFKMIKYMKIEESK